MNKKAILLIFLCISINSVGQSSYFKEVIITKTDDSVLNGYVEKVAESKLNPEIKFVRTLGTTPDIIPVSEIREIIFLSDSSLFQRIKYEYIKESSKVTEYRLAKKLTNGYAQLYKLQLPEEELNLIFEKNNTYVYILLIEDNFYTLSQKEKIVDNNYKLEKNYLGVLSYLLKDYEDLHSKVEDLEFTDKQVISLIDKLNKLHPELESEILIKKEKTIVIHGPKAGLVLANKGSEISGNGFQIGYQVSLIYPQLNEKYSLDFGLSWCKVNLTESEDYSYLRIPVGGTYRFNNSNIAPYIKGGLTFNYFYKSTIDPYINGKIGVNILQKLDVSAEVDYTPRNQVHPHNFIYFSVGYLFNK